MITATKTSTICVVGAGYVGLPLSTVLSNSYKVISFDIDKDKINNLTELNGNPNHIFTTDPLLISEADYILICVPTPLSKGKRPDMSHIKNSAQIIGQNMKKGAIVIVESSVYPGATEELFKPILEQTSGFKCGIDFRLAYSPERINPGDLEHSVDRVTKIVAACDEETLERVADLYRHVTPNIFKARNIRTAEAAKLVENTQRDLNIALINELSIIFQKIGLNTRDVLDAAGTKWNFQDYSPGMVGGYCIPVVPYFLTQKAEEYDYKPQIILAGRSVNDNIPKHISEMAIKSLNSAGKRIKGSRVMIMGCSYKENVPDTRETPVRGLIKALLEYEVEVFGYDPLIEDGETTLGINFVESLERSPKMDCIILTVIHDIFKDISLGKLLKIMSPCPIIIDVKGFLSLPEINSSGIIYRSM